jgi:hypothetical protein
MMHKRKYICLIPGQSGWNNLMTRSFVSYSRFRDLNYGARKLSWSKADGSLESRLRTNVNQIRGGCNTASLCGDTGVVSSARARAKAG